MRTFFFTAAMSECLDLLLGSDMCQPYMSIDVPQFTRKLPLNVNKIPIWRGVVHTPWFNGMAPPICAQFAFLLWICCCAGPIFVSIYLYPYLSFYLCIYVSISLSSFLSTCPVYPSPYLSIWSIYLTAHVPLCLSAKVSICLSITYLNMTWYTY